MNFKAVNVNNFPWADSTLDDIVIKHATNVIIRIFPSWTYKTNEFGYDQLEKPIEIVCKEFIAMKQIGGWDELTISSIKTSTNSEYIQEALNAILKNNPYPTQRPHMGETRHLDDPWIQLNIKLEDGADIVVVCQSIEIVQDDN